MQMRCKAASQPRLLNFWEMISQKNESVGFVWFGATNVKEQEICHCNNTLNVPVMLVVEVCVGFGLNFGFRFNICRFGSVSSAGMFSTVLKLGSDQNFKLGQIFSVHTHTHDI